MEEEISAEEPVSPTGQYFTSSVISVSVICVLESQHPIDDSQTISLLTHVFLPINPRFSSLMEKDKNGKKYWRRVEVNVQDHIKLPNFGESSPGQFYDDCFSDYLSKMAMDEFPLSRPLWEVHIIKYPTKNAAGNLVFKLHHSLGDGFSLMGALLSCLQRADNPHIPLTFPNFNPPNQTLHKPHNFCTNFTRVVNTVTDFGWSLLKSSVLEDDKTPVRSGDDGVEFRPITITTLSFCLDRIKQIKTNLHLTINDVICGVLFLGIREYMKAMKHEQRNAESTALVLLNTRNIGGYKSIPDMIKPNTESRWGNQFAFLHVPLPQITDDAHLDPLTFVHEANTLIKNKRNSGAVLLTGKLLDALRNWRGPEVTAKHIHRTLKNSSMTISNVIGPVEQMSLSNQPIKGFYFMVVGVPQSLTITMVSYMGQLRVAVGTENGLIDAPKLKSCIENAFHKIFKAAVPSPP